MRKFGAVAGLLLMLWGCGGSGGGVETPATRSYLGTEGPGDAWSWQLTDTTFTATNQTKGFHYTGTKSTLTTGFLKLTIVTTDDPNVTVGQAAYALEYPGTALLLKPAGADTKPPIIAASLGGNPAGPSVTFNFVTVPSTTYQEASDPAFGHTTFAVSGNSYAGTSFQYAISGSALPNVSTSFTASNGVMTLTGNGQSGDTGAITPTGVCVLDFGPGNGGLIGVLQPKSNVNLSDLATRSFRGFLINQGKTQCIAVTPNGDGTLHGTGYANPTGVETGTSDDGSGVTITFTGQPAPGEVQVSLATSGGAETLVAAINQVNGKYMLFGFGVPTGSNGQPYNVVLVEN